MNLVKTIEGYDGKQIRIVRGDNRVYRGHRFKYITRNSVFGIAVSMDGERRTEWCQTYAEASAQFRGQVDDILSSIGWTK